MARRHGQRGYTLIEIMIALTIGVFLTGGMLNLYIGSKRAYNIQSTLTELQEVGRFGIKSMIEDIRMAGFFGCGTTASVVNVLTGGAANWEINAAEPLRGFDAGVSVFPPNFAGNVVANTDALVLLRTQPSDAYVVDTHSTAANQLTLKGSHDLQQGEILAVTDCLNTAIFQQTNANAASVATTIDHAAGTTIPGNCAPGLGGPVDCAAGTSQPYQFPEESFITRVISRAYYIGTGASGRSALFRLDINNTGALNAPVEMADGIVDMQLVYGVDTNNDGAIEAYRTAGAIAAADWPSVLSVQINLLVESADDRVADDQTSYVLFDGTAASLVPVTPGDRRIRRVYSATTTIRNRAIL